MAEDDGKSIETIAHLICADLIGTQLNSMRAYERSMVNLSRSGDDKLNLDLDTTLGRIRLCEPVTISAIDPCGETVASSVNELKDLLVLPTAGHMFHHWYSDRENYPHHPLPIILPIVTITSMEATRMVITGRSSPDWYEPHLSGNTDINLHWVWKKPDVCREQLLPAEVRIKVHSSFGKMMWHCGV